MNRQHFKLTALTSVALLAVLATGCSTEPTPAGPAEVSVRKQSTSPAPVAPVAKLSAFDPGATPGAAAVTWGSVLDHVWLPQAVEVVAGMEGTSETTGAAYLKVPARYEQVAARVAAAQDSAQFTGYLDVDVPAAVPAASTPPVDTTEDNEARPAKKRNQKTQDRDAQDAGEQTRKKAPPATDSATDPANDSASADGTAPEAPAGKVIQGVREDIKYTLTISPDTDEKNFTVVMVKWEPYVDPLAELAPEESAPGSDDHEH